eukprot:6814379-Alexandrium_andersonii.AAC.1
MSHGRAELERAQEGELAQASAAPAPAAPAVAQTPEKIEKILAKCREEVSTDRQSNVLLAEHMSSREYVSHTG